MFGLLIYSIISLEDVGALKDAPGERFSIRSDRQSLHELLQTLPEYLAHFIGTDAVVASLDASGEKDFNQVRPSEPP